MHLCLKPAEHLVVQFFPFLKGDVRMNMKEKATNSYNRLGELHTGQHLFVTLMTLVTAAVSPLVYCLAAAQVVSGLKLEAHGFPQYLLLLAVFWATIKLDADGNFKNGVVLGTPQILTNTIVWSATLGIIALFHGSPIKLSGIESCLEAGLVMAIACEVFTFLVYIVLFTYCDGYMGVASNLKCLLSRRWLSVTPATHTPADHN